MTEDNEEHTMELTIEALTGTVYDLCVSPYETILGIKLKVQRLEGIPVYQQQLVWGGMELQDELCLEEYSIPSGAQLKLLVAMRGGPIHAQRVHLDLEDPTLLEIAELLDSQGRDKYTLMVLRNGDDLDHASFVQVQMLEEDSMDAAVRLSPIQVNESRHHLSVAASNKSTRTEHAITRDKMKELMAKFKKVKEYRQAPPPLPPQTTSNQLPHKGTGKVLIVESRSSSRRFHNSSPKTPLLSPHANEAKLAQRKLVFSEEEFSHLHHHHHHDHDHLTGKSRKRMTSCSLASRQSQEEETPIITRKHCSRVSKELHSDLSDSRTGGSFECKMMEDYRGPQTPPKLGGKASSLPSKDWHRPPKRRKRTSAVDLPDSISLSNLSRNLSRLELDTPIPTIDQCSVLEMSRSRTDFLPPIACPHLPISLTSTTVKCLTQPLPSLSITATKQGLSMSRKKRCMKCSKKMGLATTYSCRCGGLFCANHRYAETHSCTFDYKTEGRQILARGNPVVAAQKLPKI